MPNSLVNKTIFLATLRVLDELKVAPTPLPYGMSQRFRAWIPQRPMAEVYEVFDDPYLWAYAVTMEEFIALFASLPKQVFVNKKDKHA